MLAMWGPAVKPGDQARISQILVKNDRIHFEINGGAVKKQKWYQHIQFGGGGGMTSIAPSDRYANPRGSYVDLVFNGYVPDLDPQQLKDLAPPGIRLQRQVGRGSLSRHSPAQDQGRDQGAPGSGRHESRHGDGGQRPSAKEDSRERWRTEYEEWIYGEPPQDVDFVRLAGDEVVRLEIMKVDGEKIVRSEKEVELEQPTVAKGSAEPAGSPAKRPQFTATGGRGRSQFTGSRWTSPGAVAAPGSNGPARSAGSAQLICDL